MWDCLPNTKCGSLPTAGLEWGPGHGPWIRLGQKQGKDISVKRCLGGENQKSGSQDEV